MNKLDFSNISMLGRISYGILCAENYVIHKYSYLNWTPVFKKMWSIASDGYWDEWANSYMEIIPEYLFEFPDYKSSNFDYLSEDDYLIFCEIMKHTDSNFNKLLLTIYDIEATCEGTSFSACDDSSLCFLKTIENILIEENIPIPNPNIVSFSKVTEFNGWGNNFDPHSISQLLK